MEDVQLLAPSGLHCVEHYFGILGLLNTVEPGRAQVIVCHCGVMTIKDHDRAKLGIQSVSIFRQTQAGYPPEGWTAYAIRKEKELEARRLMRPDLGLELSLSDSLASWNSCQWPDPNTQSLLRKGRSSGELS